ncbi:MAG TPA: hypothetical protein VJH63_04355 [Candidatus Paceibacterota bacterium]
METLEQIFGSPTKARLLRAFIYNPNIIFDVKNIAKKIKSALPVVKKEIKILQKINLIKKRNTRDEKGRKISGYVADQNFKYINALHEFLLKVSPLTEDAIAKKLGDAGKAKLVVVSGMFLNDDNSRADMLIVSEKANEKRIAKTVADIGVEFGRDVSYALFTRDDFSYRLGMGDKLLRDIFDFPHKVILDKIGIGK